MIRHAKTGIIHGLIFYTAGRSMEGGCRPLIDEDWQGERKSSRDWEKGREE